MENNYACPVCKSALDSNNCARCGFRMKLAGGLPSFFTASPVSRRYEKIGAFYDTLYSHTEDIWNQLASRGREFDNFISSLVMAGGPVWYLDIGCGEGNLLAAVPAPEKFGMDISRKALQVAAVRAGADLCLGFAEELPYRTEFFDAITSIGVMTHFANDRAATKEIWRVLRPGGRYIAGVFIPPRLTEKIAGKVSEFVFPRPRPAGFVRWLLTKFRRPVPGANQTEPGRKDRQPIERHYKSKEVERIFKDCGFKISKVITKRKYPDAPLAGHHFRIYILTKDIRSATGQAS